MADANNLAFNFLFLSQASQKETSLQEIKFFSWNVVNSKDHTVDFIISLSYLH